MKAEKFKKEFLKMIETEPVICFLIRDYERTGSFKESLADYKKYIMYLLWMCDEISDCILEVNNN